MIDGISEADAKQEEQPVDAQLATVGAVYEDGLTLVFDGQEAATEKHYKCNTAIAFKAGDRVKVARISGSYVVEYVVGSPNSGGVGVSELVNGNYKVTLYTTINSTNQIAALQDVVNVLIELGIYKKL